MPLLLAFVVDVRNMPAALLACLALGCGARTGLETPMRAPSEDGGRDLPVRCEREIVVEFAPTARAQIAVWVTTSTMGSQTLMLTDAVGRRGIGNRPGASQMNSGYHWPYGRRVDVLPLWASARLAGGGLPFPTVVFHRRRSEGDASSAETPDPPPQTNEPYFCLSFVPRQSDRDHLDATSCASMFHGDKGRYFDSNDLATHYGEPVESMGTGLIRELAASAAYPPRIDYMATDQDHPDVGRFRDDALRAMPELDAITRPTPAGDTMVSVRWRVPAGQTGDATITVEINTEGDYGGRFTPAGFPTPTLPAGAWDEWSINYGYPYRGQPSLAYSAEIPLPAEDGEVPPVVVTTDRPASMGSWDGTLATGPVEPTIVDDPIGAPGSGADRLLRRVDGARLRVTAHQLGCLAATDR